MSVFDTTAQKQGYNFGNQRGDRMSRWLAAIRRDRNYARLLMRLPLQRPVSESILETAWKLGYEEVLIEEEEVKTTPEV